MRSVPSRRINAFKYGFLALLVILVGRLYQLQIMKHEELNHIADRQLNKTLTLQPDRGTIQDRGGRELAISIPVESVYAMTSQIADPAEAASRLSSALSISRKRLHGHLGSDRNFVWIKRKITPQEAQAVREMNLRGIGFVEEMKRYYPRKSLGSPLIGFVGLDNYGLAGLEYHYDEEIRGEPEELRVLRDALGRAVRQDIPYMEEGKRGKEIILTIDEPLQYVVERELARQVAQTKALGGVALVMEPRTGEILALAEEPAFNPNSFDRYDRSTWKIDAVNTPFEPGSTFKIVPAAGVLQEGLGKPSDMYYCEDGEMTVGGRVFHDVHRFRWLSMTDVIAHSSNIGAYKITTRLGDEKFHHYIRRFGFGSKTGIDLPGEAEGLVRNPREWSRFSLASLSIGQEISVTPVQLISAYAAIANGGLLMKPFVVKALVDEGAVMRMRPEIRRRVLSEETARTLKEILRNCVEYGTCRGASLDGYEVAGKTGTAQKVDPSTGGYSSGRFESSFVGFLPVENPAFVILVKIDEPKGEYYASQVAAPLFRRIAEFAVKRFGIPPSEGGGLLVLRGKEEIGEKTGSIPLRTAAEGEKVDALAVWVKKMVDKVISFYKGDWFKGFKGVKRH